MQPEPPLFTPKICNIISTHLSNTPGLLFPFIRQTLLIFHLKLGLTSEALITVPSHGAAIWLGRFTEWRTLTKITHCYCFAFFFNCMPMAWARGSAEGNHDKPPTPLQNYDDIEIYQINIFLWIAFRSLKGFRQNSCWVLWKTMKLQRRSWYGVLNHWAHLEKGFVSKSKKVCE